MRKGGRISLFRLPYTNGSKCNSWKFIKIYMMVILISYMVRLGVPRHVLVCLDHDVYIILNPIMYFYIEVALSH